MVCASFTRAIHRACGWQESFPEKIRWTVNDFGTIGAQSQTYAQWWFRSTLLGHFISYEASYTHVTSYGNEDLSLIDTVRVHELIHGFTTDDVTGKRMRGFLVNDMPDADDMPDNIHFTNATQERVPGIHGTVTPQVRLVPNVNSGEGPEAQGNNTATGSNVQLDARLYLSISKSLVDETYDKPLNVLVTRSGNRDQALVVSLVSDDSRLTLPSTVTIDQGQSSANVTATLINNSIVDEI